MGLVILISNKRKSFKTSWIRSIISTISCFKQSFLIYLFKQKFWVFYFQVLCFFHHFQVLCRKPVSTIINMLNSKGCTPFHLACMADKTDCVMELLKAGVDVNLSCGMHFINENTIPITDSPSRLNIFYLIFGLKNIFSIYAVIYRILWISWRKSDVKKN